MKRRLYLAQVNHRYGDNVFLPYSVGVLWAYARKDPVVAEHFHLEAFLFEREPVGEVVRRMVQPDVVGISCYIWNRTYSTALAVAVKERWPDCMVVMGGPEVPLRAAPFLAENPAIDITVHNEGERPFAAILRRLVTGEPLWEVPGLHVAFAPGGTIYTGAAERVADLTQVPSPYLEGVFDDLVARPLVWQASQETHRGCPYSCTFCDWGSAVHQKVRAFDDARLRAELDWFGRHKIDLIYNCDANYGLLKRDLDLTAYMVEVKERHGHPRKFRASYAKKSNERVFEITRLLHDADMSKGATLSMQSMDADVLEIVKRSNIRLDDFRGWLGRYNANGMATYTEVIVGLPGESYASFARGLDEIMEAGQHDSINVYPCMMLVNSEMAHPEYVAKHGIRTVRMPIMWSHAAGDDLVEYNDIVVETATMSRADWKRMFRLAWAVQAFHCLGLTQVAALWARHVCGTTYIGFYEALLAVAHRYAPRGLLVRSIGRLDWLLDDVLAGGSWNEVVEAFGPVNWPTEEATFLRMVVEKARFYDELAHILDLMFLPDGRVQRRALADVVAYQEAVIRGPHDSDRVGLDLAFDVPQFVHDARMGQPAALKRRRMRITVTSEPNPGTLADFAREVVWYGRKGGTLRHKHIETVEV